MTGFADAKSDSWMYGGFHTYLLLNPGSEIKKMEARFPEMVRKYMGPQIQQQMGLSLDQFTTKGNRLGFALQPLTDIHLNAFTTTELEPGGNKMYVYIFVGIALFMVVIACVNFVNLSTANASNRAKEVGIRKVVGSDRYQLATQFISESIFIACLSLFIACDRIQLALPIFNNIATKDLSFDAKPIFAYLALGMLVRVVASIYPALY